MSEHLIERLQQWPSCPAGLDPLSSAYVGDLMKEAAAEIERLRAVGSIADWLAKRVEQAHEDAEAHPEGHGNRAFYRGQAVAYENALSAALASSR